MKYLRQFCIILLFSFLGEGLHIILPLPVPASVYGLVLMLADRDSEDASGEGNGGFFD